jgi:hypothetical protein
MEKDVKYREAIQEEIDGDTTVNMIFNFLKICLLGSSRLKKYDYL